MVMGQAECEAVDGALYRQVQSDDPALSCMKADALQAAVTEDLVQLKRWGLRMGSGK
jgi:hypothetical protein